MAQHSSAKKRIRRDEKQTLRNHSRISRVRTFIKKVESAIVAGDQAAAQAALRLAQPEIMRGVSKGVLHSNTAARKMSRLNAGVAKLASL
jgi:small subunit ribosomal protein S20